MPHVKVMVRRRPKRLPPADVTKSTVWHACCPICYIDRGVRGRKLPANHVGQNVLCCFCRERPTGFRIRLAGQTRIPCTHRLRGTRGA